MPIARPARSARERTLVFLVASLAVISFVESYRALQAAAETGGRPWPWLWPFAVEGFILAMNMAIWDARAGGRRAPWAWTLLVVATAVSTVLQTLDAPHTRIGLLTAGWTPIALLLSFERWMWLAYGTLRISPVHPGHAETPLAADEGPPPAQPPLDEQPDELPPPPAPERPSSGAGDQAARLRVRELVAHDPDVHWSTIVEQTGVSRTRAYQLRKEELRRLAANGQVSS